MNANQTKGKYKTMKYSSVENKKDYFPPLLSNGEISFAPDAEGMLGYSFSDYRNKGIHAFDGMVVRSARRTAPQADAATVSRDLFLNARKNATANPIAAEEI